ncbi:GTP:AMP phosphotransferase AK3, mitochondrial-like [Ornithodoros turicata]|uniref:GTP:AMP phosphotransferase AK3, mitochondrial-like n=1 Tax=Ornithodoros turicata TaxID=34597 RepID=UPI003138E379
MKMSKIFRALIMGPPGSGKGTISEWIIRDFALKGLACGEIIRQNILNRTEDGLIMETYLEKGALVPDDLVTRLTLNYINTRLKDQPWLLDGFPRTVPQAEALSKNTVLACVIDLAVPEDEIRRRIEGRWIHAASGRTYHTAFNPPKVPGKDDVTGEDLVQRIDDKPETVRARLESYRMQTEPVLEYYQKRGLLHEFRGTKSKEIFPHVYNFLSTLRKPVRPLSL